MAHVRLLLEAGTTWRETSFQTKVPFSTVARWARGRTASFGPALRRPARRPVQVGWQPPDRLSYAYLLGLYLGDGCLTLLPRTVALTISLDGIYPEIIEDAAAAMKLTALHPKVRSWPVKNSRCINVKAYWRGWLVAFPQHGAGRKHERKIALAKWQQEIVEEHTAWFVRGLIHSDGCRTVNRFKTKLPSGRVAQYAYPRYFFSNLSSDIRGLFCDACDRLEIRWSLSNPRNVSVSHRDSVAKLDRFVGPKS